MSMLKSTTLRALDAFAEGVHTAPARANDPEAWGGISVCEWDLPWLDGFELAENDDLVIAYHSAGSRSVRAACNGPWSDRYSVPGLISVIPPGSRVEYRIDGAVCFSSIHIPHRAVSRMAGSSNLPMKGIHFAFSDAYAQASMDVLLNEARRGARDIAYVTTVARALTMHLLNNFRREQADAGKPVEIDTLPGTAKTSGIPLNPIMAFIDANLASPLTLDNLADQAGVSRAHFARYFRSITGVSPHRFVTLRRIEKAKQLLSDGRPSMVQIAQDVGFSNQSHFSQVFHAVTGKTPSQYRNDD
jgi:AraC family transcriptional regulator